MYSKGIKRLVTALLVVLLISVNGSAVKVGVIATFPDGSTRTGCVAVIRGANGYETMESAGFDVVWGLHEIYGHSLCAISGTGCPSSNCFCDTIKYWNFYVKGAAGGEWTYSATGFDGGITCAEHYCASHGGLIGLAYGPYGTKPADYSFNEVCVGGDANGDGYVDYADLITLATAYGRAAGEEGYSLQADHDGDGTIGYRDLVLLAANYRS